MATKTKTVKTPKTIMDLGIKETSLNEAVLKKLAKECYILKQKKSLLEAQYKKYDKAVKTTMEKLGLRDYEFDLTIDKQPQKLRLGFIEKIKNTVDVKALAKILKDKKDKFFKIVSATQKAVNAELGESVTNQILVENVTESFSISLV